MMTKETARLITKAEKLCEQRGARLTPARREVFEILAAETGAIGAYDLLDKLRSAVPNAKPPTIYRALDFLQEQGFVHKITSSNSYVLCSHFDHQHPVQMLICESCGSVQEIQSEGVYNALRKQAEDQGFQVVSQSIEAHGLCRDCA
ncbi:zinc uptake transcriptional repressor Zur [Pseudidiomarina terrestris]|uniref:Ferric uptake regulation protein n=1 Tax=Pseudidiomarina terrestris TaxID=2820060 RepID=A0AAW7QZ51_9GAMM|nr:MULTISPECIES: zinc uptake transcriptional repressor Zur [unclassified Pseudidiomarina]MDN7123841.1 zinc uptake transcriptional repressor Zur [Pseudidiomarina sp. 1APP75-32.1]MDN7127595.1 zinc uptake transcriptional repressor Zur [Pseudidiomarina sp. 1APR75-33.1]MDN7130341.1 zinc uptake transcriptional repressor Zur [Pseudidiomarina sp. 1APR75-15]MDN7136264.1 zinc uptake transcriptional repressor Zur [Pseudidiomarina sp. 1ASP75-5]MDN7138819.1 zinc uptake transcriptional repressor Zur [Pseudi